MNFWTKHREKIEFGLEKTVDVCADVITHGNFAAKEAFKAVLNWCEQKSFDHFVSQQEAREQEHFVLDGANNVWVQNAQEKPNHNQEQVEKQKVEETEIVQTEQKEVEQQSQAAQNVAQGQVLQPVGQQEEEQKEEARQTVASVQVIVQESWQTEQWRQQTQTHQAQLNQQMQAQRQETGF